MSKTIVDVEGKIPLALAGAQLFSTWSDAARDRMAKGAALLEVAKGETIVEVGEKPSGVFVVITGALSNGVTLDSGERFLNSIVRPGWVVQIAQVWEGQNSPNNLTARSDALAAHIPVDVFLQVANSDIQHVRDIATFACRVYRASLLRANLLATMSLRCQVAAMLIYNSLSESVVLPGVPASSHAHGFPVGQTDVTQDELAAMVGYSRQQVNAVMKGMENDGILRRRGRLTDITNYLLLIDALEEGGALFPEWRLLVSSWQERLENATS